jgi:hypothetical protein
MPFLTKKLDSRSTDVRIPSAAGAESALLWEGDVYRPSRGLESGVEVPAFGQSIQRRLCGSVECVSTWTVPWRNRRRPIFEGQWGCSGRCVLAMVRSAMSRELGEGEAGMAAAPHRHRVPLGLVLLAQGWITHPQLRHALESQRVNGRGRIGDWLVAECGLEAEQITRGLSLQWSCPVLSVRGFVPEAMALVMPRVFVEEFGLLPLRVVGSRILYIGLEDRLDASAALAMEQMVQLKVESGLVDSAQFREARSQLLQCDAIETKMETAVSTTALAARVTAILEQKQPVASRLVRLHQYYWLRVWLESGATGKSGTLPKNGEDVQDYVFSLGGRA